MDRRIILVTGASSGLGRACADHLHARGFRVYGTSRRGPECCNAPYTILPVDVTDPVSVGQAVSAILEREGRLDVVVNNAGMGIAGSVEDTAEDEMQAQMETNFMGMARLCRAALRVMRPQGAGLIINVSSIGGLYGLPFQAYYSASKFAVEGLSEALRYEVRPFGVQVALVEPGDFRTGFTGSRRWTAATETGSPYAEQARRTVNIMARDEQNGADPAQFARLVERIIRTPKPKARYVTGSITQRVMAFARGKVPHALVELGMRLIYRID
jgi:NAD(P)-dependent dehydrogenase (short-subunit alcohol dehydrogenase family)